MSVTYGLFGEYSSKSARLQSSLANKLQANLPVRSGSPEYSLTWNHWDIPSRPPICQLRASARRTYVRDYGGWHTPRANDSKKRGRISSDPRNGLPGTARLVGWATPRKFAHKDAREDRGKCNLGEQVHGITASGFPSEMEEQGELNPELARWLIGFPPEWAEMAPDESHHERG